MRTELPLRPQYGDGINFFLGNQVGSVATFAGVVCRYQRLWKTERRRVVSISFKWAQYPKSVILFAVLFYLRYPVSYRDLEEIMADPDLPTNLGN